MALSQVSKNAAYLVVLCLLAPCPRALGQSCIYSFSEYFNNYVSSDGSTLYSQVSVYDYSGCNHSQYVTTATLVSPSGRAGSAQAPGLSATAGLALNNEAGAFTATTSGSFFCPVFRAYAGFGGGEKIDWAAYFGIFEDSAGRVLLTQADFNTLVSNGLIAAATGVIILVPGAGEIVLVAAGTVVVAVAIGYLTYQAAKYIRDNLHPLATGPCTLSFQQNVPYTTGGIGSGTVQCAYVCRGYGALVVSYCPTGKNCAAYIPDGWIKPARDCQ